MFYRFLDFMDRAQVVSQTIATFNTLRDKATELFSEESILSRSELMIEEYFEAKFNPFLRKAKATIESIPLNDYTVVAIDSWIKNLKVSIDHLEGGTHSLRHAESVYIHQKYLPQLVNFLGNVKLEVLESIFKTHEEVSAPTPISTVKNHKGLAPGALSSLIAQLLNFGVFRNDLSPDMLARVLAPVLGCNAEDIANNLTYDKESHRFAGSGSAQELAALAKLMRSIAARIENQQNALDRE